MSGLTIAAMLIAAAQTPLASTMIAVALADIGASLAVDLSLATGLLVATYMVLTVVGQNPGGKLADIFGRWRTLETGIAICFFGALIGAVAPAFWLLVVARCLIALGGALIAPSVLALLRAHVPEERRGRMFGAYSATVGLAAALGPPVGAELVHFLGWRGVFVVNLPLLLLAAALGRAGGVPPGAPRQHHGWRVVAKSFDWLGTILLAAALAALWSARLWTLLIAAGAASAFILWERRAADPVLQPALLANRTFAAGCSVILLQSLAMYGVIFQLPQYFEVVRGATPRESGAVLFVMMAGLFVASIFGGTLTDRLGARPTALGGVGLMVVGILWLTRIGTFERPAEAFAPALLLGLALGATWTSAQSAAMSAVAEGQSGMAAGTTSTCRYLGGAIGVLILAAFVGRPTLFPPDAHAQVMWVFAAAIALSTIGCMVLPGRIQR
ncbi:MAG: MFS transporter [Propylenella sp.]